MPGRQEIPERFLTTVVMTDIVGSTEHAAELGDSAWRELLQQHHALIRAELRRHGGREIDTAGDGFFVIFDAPATAVACVLAIADNVRSLGLEIRAGVHVGEVQQMAGKVTGIAVVIASRIMANAGAGEVFVSATVRDLAAGSGLTFDDRGLRPLKGVPGEWHVYAVGRAESETLETGQPVARERRAAAVRRAQARPIWQRRPWLSAGLAAALAVLLATSSLLVLKPWQPPALASVDENSIGVIDPDRDELIGQIGVGTQPSGIAVGEGFAWVANTGSDTVSQIDLITRSAVNRIPVGRAPTGIAVAHGSVWVTNSGERSVSRISVATGRVVDTIDVGNGPTAIAGNGDWLWVANATDSTVVRLDAGSGAVGDPTGVAATPVALAADADGLWVASEFVVAISHLNPITGGTIALIQLGERPSAIALDPDSVWVAGADGTVTRIDRDTNRVTRTIDLGGQLDSIAITEDSVWVGDRNGYVDRLSRTGPSSPTAKIAAVSSVGAVAVVEGNVWIAAQASVANHRGGTLRIVLPSPNDTDPLGLSAYNASLLEADGLVGYRRVGGVAGAALLPDLASAIPRPTNGGLTYTFQLRPNLVYSTGEPVRPADFRRALERSFQVGSPYGLSGDLFYRSIAGTDACVTDDGSPVERCDLSKGIQTDDTTKTITFNLSKPDPDFLNKLAMPNAYPVPEGVAMHGLIRGAFPGTGPYRVAAVSDSEIRLVRNPQFEVWDAAVRPDGFPDEIVFSVVEDDAQRIAMVESGEADYLHRSRAPPELFQGSASQYGGQWHVASSITYAIWMNTAIPPFDNDMVRQAVNFAIDRRHMAAVYGGPPVVAVTCQILPPGFPGYEPYCPYTLDPDRGGHWEAPDLEEAHRLVEASGTAGQHVVVGPSSEPYSPERDYLASVLRKLGYKVSNDTQTDFDHLVQATNAGIIETFPTGWAPDFLAPSIFFSLFTCNDANVLVNFCDQEFDRAYNEALDLQTTDPSAAWKKWAELDRRAVDLGLWAPLYNAAGDFVSARVGNYQFSPTGSVLFDQMWVQSGATVSPTPTLSPASPEAPIPVKWLTDLKAPDDKPTLYLNVAVDSRGSIYATDGLNDRIVVWNAAGRPTIWGKHGRGPGEFDFSEVTRGDQSMSVGVAPDGRIAVGDGGNHRVQIFDANRRFLQAIGRKGTGQGRFVNPCCVVFDAQGRLYVADPGRDDIQIFDKGGTFIRAIGSSGSGNGQFRRLGVPFIDAATGNIWVPDFANRRVEVVAPDGTFVASYGDGQNGNPQLAEVNGVVLDKAGRMFVVDTNDFLWVLDPSGNTLWRFGPDFPGAGHVAPPYLLLTDDGKVYLPDTVLGNNRIAVLQLQAPLWPPP